jgi:N-acetylglucosamine kinase-like BadF-type ATPase
MNLIIDLGQSGVRIKIGDEIITKSISKNSDSSTLETLSRVCEAIPQGTYEDVFLSLTGLNGKVRNQSAIGELFHLHFKSTSVAVMDDGFAAYFGALGKRNGVVLAIGSGVVAVSGNNGNFAHTDGKGSIFGDFGSGFWIGQAALRRAISTLDGRDTAPELVQLLEDQLGQLDLMENRVGPEASQLCISSAKRVVEGAEQGVEPALQILDSGASYLAGTLVSAWHKVKSPDSERPLIVLTGGLSRSSLYADLIKEQTSKLLDCSFVEAEADHLVGAEFAAATFPYGVAGLFEWVRFT